MERQARRIVEFIKDKFNRSVTEADVISLRQAMENEAATSECVLQEKIGRSEE